jgi:hypothetical protein
MLHDGVVCAPSRVADVHGGAWGVALHELRTQTQGARARQGLRGGDDASLYAYVYA